MLELALIFLAGCIANRVGASIVRRLPDESPLKRPGAVIFGGPGPWRPPK